MAFKETESLRQVVETWQEVSPLGPILTCRGSRVKSLMSQVNLESTNEILRERFEKRNCLWLALHTKPQWEVGRWGNWRVRDEHAILLLGIGCFYAVFIVLTTVGPTITLLAYIRVELGWHWLHNFDFSSDVRTFALGLPLVMSWGSSQVLVNRPWSGMCPTATGRVGSFWIRLT